MTAGILGGIVAALLITLAVKTLREPRLDRDGWYTLRPSWIIHGTMVLCSLFLVLFVWLWFNGAKADEPGERFSLAALTIFFAAGAAYFVVTVYARTIAWSDSRLRLRRWFRDDEVRDFSEVSSVVRNDITGTYTLTFTDGSRLQFPIAMHGANELATRLGLTE